VFPDREHFGRISSQPGEMSALGIPQGRGRDGSCTAGGAYVPAMRDETVIVGATQGTISRRPTLVKQRPARSSARGISVAATCTHDTSGVADHLAENDAHGAVIARASSRTSTVEAWTVTLSQRGAAVDPGRSTA